MLGSPRLRRVLLYLGEALLIVAVVVGVRAYLSRGATRGPAPPIAAQSLDGQIVSLAAVHGRPVLVYFWATWCPVCGAMRGTIANIARDHPVITVAIQSGSGPEIAAYLNKHQWRVRVINDADGNVARLYGVRGVPASFVIDGNGNIRAVEIGYTTEIGLRLRLWWAGWDYGGRTKVSIMCTG